MNEPIKLANSATTTLLTASTKSSDDYDLFESESLAVLNSIEAVLWDIQVCCGSASHVAPDRYQSLVEACMRADGEAIFEYLSLMRGALLIIDQLFMNLLTI